MQHVTEFLSDAWIEALDAQFATAAGGSTAAPVVVQYLVDTGSRVVEYHLELGPGRDRARAGRSPDADVTFSMTIDTAARISAGELSSEEAFVTGLMTLDGDATTLVEAHRAREEPGDA